MSFLSCFGGARAALAELCAADRELLVYLADLAPAERHLIALATLEWRHDAAAIPAARFASMLRRAKRRDLLRAVVPGAPDGAVTVLRKVAGPVRAHAFYRELLRLLGEEGAALALRSARRVTPALVRGLAAIEPALRVPGLADVLKTEEDIRRFRYAIGVIRRLRPEVTDRDLAEWLSRIEPKSAVFGRFKVWLDASPLPEAWAGTERLRLLGTVSDIKRTGSEFENCFASIMLPKVLKGHCALYRWDGPEKAVVSLEADPFLGWLVDDIRGPKNKQVRYSTRRAILQECATAGIHQGPNWTDFLFEDDE